MRLRPSGRPRCRAPPQWSKRKWNRWRSIISQARTRTHIHARACTRTHTWTIVVVLHMYRRLLSVSGAQGLGRPERGFAKYTWSKIGTYRGEWSRGLPHGEGTLYYNTGVRYTGSWHNGNPCGEGAWTRENPVPPPAPPPEVTKCKCSIPVGQVQRHLIEPVGYAVYLRQDWPPGVNPSDRKTFARHLACWWPRGNQETNSKVSKTDFYKQTLKKRTS